MGDPPGLIKLMGPEPAVLKENQPPDIPAAPAPSEPPNLIPISKPGDSAVRGVAQQALTNYVANSADPMAEEARIRGAFFLSQVLGIDAGDAFRRYPEYVEAWTGKRLEPVSALKAMTESWEIGWKIVEQGRAGWSLMLNPTSEKHWRELEEIQRDMPPEDQIKRSLPVEMFKALLKQLPFMLEIQKYGIAGLGIGAAAGAGGALAAGALVPTPEEIITVPAAIAKFGHIGWQIGNVFGASRTTAGLIFSDIMQMEDEFGNKVPIDIARGSSLGGGFLSGLMEAATLNRLAGGSSAVRRALTKLVPLTLRKSGAGFGRNALAFMTKYGTNIGVELVQELSQESVEFASKEIAIAMANAREDFNIPQAELDDFLEILEQTTKQTLLAVPLMVLPGTAIEFGRTGRAAAESRAAATPRTTLDEALETIIETADEASLDSVLEEIDKLKPEPDVELEVKAGETGYQATEKVTGRSVGSLQYTRLSDDIIQIDALEAETPAARLAMAMELKKEHTGTLATLNPDAPNAEEIRRAIEDTDPELEGLNAQLDLVESNIEGLIDHITELDMKIKEPTTPEEAVELEELREELTETQEALETAQLRQLRIQEVKQKVNPADTREAWEKPAEDFEQDDRARDDVRVETFTNQVAEAFPQYKPEEVEAAVGLVEARARAMGMKAGDWIEQYLAPEVFAPAAVSERVLSPTKARAGVQFLEDGKAILHASKRADVSSWVHEMAHIFRRQVDPEQLRALEQWAGVENGLWTPEQEDAFAKGLEEYIRSGYAPNSELAAFFEQFTRWLREIYKKIRELVELSPEIQAVYDELFKVDDAVEEAAALRIDRETKRHRDAKKVSGAELVAGKYQWEMDIAEYEERLALGGRLLDDIPDAELLDAISSIRRYNYRDPETGKNVRTEPVPRDKLALRVWAEERIENDYVQFVRENQGRTKALEGTQRISLAPSLIPEDRSEAIIAGHIRTTGGWMTFAHRRFVEKALKAGIRVKPAILSEYRDLAEQYPNLMDPDYVAPDEFDQVEREHEQQELALEDGEVLYQLSKTQFELAARMGTLTDTARRIFSAFDRLAAMDTEAYNWIVGRGAYEGQSRAVGAGHKNIFELNAYLDANPDVTGELRQLEKLFNSRILDVDGHLVASPLEQRMRVKQKATYIRPSYRHAKTYDEMIGKEYQLFKSAYRNIGQRLLDNMDPKLFEQIRGELVRATELAYEQKAELPTKFAKHLNKTVDAIESKFVGIHAAIRTAHKTEAAANLRGECPMLMIGGRGCWLDKCYVTEMARGGSAQNLYSRAMYTGELLQLAPAEVARFNKDVGGLRVNGQGDLTKFNRAQLRDLMKHAGMVGLELKLITKQTDVMDMVNSFLKDNNPNVRKAAEDIVIQASVDPWWVRVETDVSPGSLASQYVPSYMKAVERGDKEQIRAMTREVIKMYKDAGRDAKIIGGQLYRKYGFSSRQIGAIAKRYPKLKIQIRDVVSTPKEIAETALRLPQVLQTWMHADLPGTLWSETEQAFLQDVQRGNYTTPIVIRKTNGGNWQVLAQKKPESTEGIRRPDYTAVEDYIKENYNAVEQEKIFSTLAGQLEKNPSALCCKAGSSANICNNCLSLCHGHSFLQGDKLAALAQTAKINLLFQGPLDEFNLTQDLAGKTARAGPVLPAPIFKTSTDHVDYHDGQNDYVSKAYDSEGNLQGYVQFSEFQGQYQIDFIEVKKESRRQGIASQLIDEILVSQGIDYADLQWGMMTEKGKALQESLNAFYRTSPDLLFQPGNPEHERIVKEAFDAGRNVPDQMLETYRTRKWAATELDRREQERQKLIDHEQLGQDALEHGSPEEFIEFIEAMGFEETEGDFEESMTLEERHAWLTDFYLAAHANSQQQSTVLNINEGNRRWYESLDDEILIQMLEELGTEREGAMNMGFHGTMIAAGLRLKGGRNLTPKLMAQIRKILQNNTTKYRTLWAQFQEDQEALQRIELEQIYSQANEIDDETYHAPPRDRSQIIREVQELRKRTKAETGEINIGEIDELLQEINRELAKSMNEEKRLLKEANADRRRIERGGEVLEDLTKQQKEEIRELKKQTTAVRNEAIKNERLRIRELEKERKAARALKEYARKLSKSITRQVPKTIDRVYAEQIQALQAGVDPNFRTKRTLRTWQNRQGFFNANPETYDNLSARTKQRMYQRSLNDIPISELEDISGQVDHLIKLGRLKLRLRREGETREIAQIASRLGTTVLKGEELHVTGEEAEPILEGKTTVGQVAAEAFLRTLRPSRLADMVDDGADFHGLAHQEFIDKVNDAYNEEIRQRMRREAVVTDKLAELKITVKDLAAKRAEVAGHDISLDQILKMYANLQNELNTKAMVHGNNISLELAEELIGKLSASEMAFADFIIEEYDDNYDRLEAAHIMLTNERLQKQRRYTPMGRMEVDMTPHPETLADEMSQGYGIRRGRVFKGMTIKRLNVPEEGQKPIDLSGLYIEWGQQIVKQEHYINSAPLVHKLRRILSVRALKASFAQKGKQALHKRLERYVDRYANPNVMYSMGNDNRLFRAIRRNTALAYLAFNMVTGVKQLVSLAYYSAAASPADLASGLMQTAFHWSQTREQMMRLAPQLIDRSIEREFEELKRLKNKGFQKITKKFGKVGMWHILTMDKIAVTAGWKAIFDKQIRHGASETEAAQEATNVTLRTQPAFTAKDVAEIYASDGFMSMFLQFSNQLNQLWNMAVYDAPKAFKNKHYARGFAMYGSFALSGAFMWMLSKRRLPEDAEDWASMAKDTILKPVPLLGGAIASAMDGYSAGNVSFYKIPTAIGRNMDMILDAVVAGKDISEKRLAGNIKALIESQAVFWGLPGYLEGKRIVEGVIKGVENESAWTPVQYIMLGGEIKPKKER